MLKPVRTVAPTTPAVSLDDAKQQCRIDHGDEDEKIKAFVDAATDAIDAYGGLSGRALITQTWRQDFDGFFDWRSKNAGIFNPADRAPYLRLSIGDVQSVSSITYYDSNNAQQTLSPSVYTVLQDAIGPYVTLQQGQTWPSTAIRDDAVRITWVAGFGNTPDDVPAKYRQAILLLVAQWYENREDVLVDYRVTVSELPWTVKMLIGLNRVDSV